MSVAHLTSQLSCCDRMKVGAVIVKDKRIICCGYNGRPAGSRDNNCEDSAISMDESGNEVVRLITRPDVLHAEENAILFAAQHGLSLKDCSIWCTHAPCINCARMIHGAGISGVFYDKIYRDQTGLKYLESVGKLCVRVEL